MLITAGCFDGTTPTVDAGGAVDVSTPTDTNDAGPSDVGFPTDAGHDVGADVGVDAGHDVGVTTDVAPLDTGCSELSPCIDSGFSDAVVSDVTASDVNPSDAVGEDATVVDGGTHDVATMEDQVVVDVPSISDVPAVPDVPPVSRRRGSVLVMSNGGGLIRSASYTLHAEIAYGAPAGATARSSSQGLLTSVVSRP